MAKIKKTNSNRRSRDGNNNDSKEKNRKNKNNGNNGNNGRASNNKVEKISRNPYLNFAKRLRSENTYATMKELFKDAASKWNQLSLEEKQKYCQEARDCDTLTMIAPFYILGEKELGRTYRKDLAKFKKLLDKSISDKVKEVKKLKAKSK